MPVPRISVETGLYSAIFLLGFALRIWDAGSRAMHGDESVHAWLAWNLFTGTGYAYDPVYHGPFQFPITALFFFLFGSSNLTGRLLSILFGSALVLLPFAWRRLMGRAEALLASFLIAVSPAFVYTARLERDDMFSALFAFTTAIALFWFLRSRAAGALYLAAASLAFSLAAMENTYITLFVMFTFLGIALLSEYLAGSSRADAIGRLWERTGAAGVVRWPVWAAFCALVLVMFLLTVATGLYLPVPLVVGLGLVALVHRQAFFHARAHPDGTFLAALRSTTRGQWLNVVTIVVAILVLFFSTFGTNLRGIWDAAQPFFNTGNACPGNPFPLNPCRKDIIGGLFYWLSQHRVHRGGQPWYYYFLLNGLYEQIALLFGLAGALWTFRRPTLFKAFLAYWAILMFGIYSWAGEKFPWLMVHPLIPMTLLAAMFLMAVLREARWTRYLVGALAAIFLLLELHNTYEVNFVNGADPVEMMVYVQSSPDTPRVAQSILAISNKVTNGNGLHVTIDSLDTWPFAWYLRQMPNVAYPSSSQLTQSPFATNPVILVDESDQPFMAAKLSHYTGKKYRLRWWFPEDYKSLTWGSFFRDAVNPGYWRVIGQWQIQRRPFGPKDAVWFYYYVKKGLVAPF